MSEIFNFENLVVYQRSLVLVEHIYLLSQKFPKEEMYALNSQIRRAAVSVPSNIAEGMSRYSNKEKGHFIEISYSSLMEVYCQLNIAKRLNYISDKELIDITEEIKNIARPLSGLRNSLNPKPPTLNPKP